LVVEQGSAAEVARGADDFARFYLTKFYPEILAAYVKRRRRVYTLAALIAFAMALASVVPLVMRSTSLFAYTLIVMGLMLIGVVVFCVIRILQAPAYCKEHLGEFFEVQIAASKLPAHAVTESRFYEDRLEVLRGKTATERRKVRPYHEIPRVYETEALYFFQGVGWIHKERLDERQHKLLRTIITDSFGVDRHIWVDVIFG
jgi:hypothetical protein